MAVKANLLSNLFSRLWMALSSLIFVPFYIKYLGMEAYGLIGFFAVISGFISLLDMGLSGAINREMARLSVLNILPEEYRNLTRTLEFIYWGVAIFIAGALFFAATFIANKWVQPQQLSLTVVREAIILMGISLAVQWPSSLYSNALMGLQKQFHLNLIIIIISTIRSICVLMILKWVSSTISAFFIWTALMSTIQTMLLAFCLWKFLPASKAPAKFDFKLLYKLKGYATGMAFLSVITLILVNMDKIVLSKILTLEMFGYYSLATAIAMSLYCIISPLFSTYFPRYSQLVALDDQKNLAELYHNSSQVMSIILFPVSLVLIMFSQEIIFTWTHNWVTTQKVYPLVSLLALGNLCNGLMNMPFALQLSHGCTKIVIYQNIVALVVLLPFAMWLGRNYEGQGVASLWFAYNAACLFIVSCLIHRRFLKGELKSWFLTDLGKPFIGSLLVVLVFRWIFPTNVDRLIVIIYLSIAILCAFVAAASLTPISRRWFKRKIVKV